MTGWTRWQATGVAVALLCSLQVAAAQQVGGCAGSAVPADADDQAMAPPLDRQISVELQNVKLRDAIDRAATAGRINLSYSREFLPDRRVCLGREPQTLGRVFQMLLAGTNLEAVAIGGDQVVLRRVAPPSRTAADMRSDQAAQPVESVVVVGNRSRLEDLAPAGSGSRTVLDLTENESAGATSLATLLDGRVPGMWAWDAGGSMFAPRYSSVRGASAFGSSGLKTYIDGVEVANAMVSTLIAPDNIERVEIIRGPQGAALYGADALNGVMNITTRHDGAPAAGSVSVHAQTATGVVQSDYATAPLFSQNHAVTLRAGSSLRNFTVGLTHSQIGAYAPGGQSQQTSALATARRVGATSVLGLTARIADEHVASSQSSLLASISPAFSDSTAGESLSQYTFGVTAQLMPNEHWTHSLVVGADGYRVSGPEPTIDASSLSTERALTDPPWSADRASIRASSVLHLTSDDSTLTTLTLAAEHTALRQVADAWVVQPVSSRGPGSGRGMLPYAQEGQTTTISEWRRNTGVSTQVDMTFRNGIGVTGGLRLEHVGGLVGPASLAALPLMAASIDHAFGPLAIRAHGAYGKGIRSPRAAIGVAIPNGEAPVVGVSDAMPEEQTGSEIGLDLSLGRSVTFRATRFVQTASRLTQAVALPSRDGARSYTLENIGSIVNRGWELEQRISISRVSFGSTLSLIDSRVGDVARGYTGDLRSGDRTLAVPAMIAGMSLTYGTSRTSASLDLSRATDWINYDVLALQRADSTPSGEALRSYWRSYTGATGLRASASRALGRGLTLTFSGDNLLGRQRGVPDNATIVPGRTTTLGLRVQF